MFLRYLKRIFPQIVFEILSTYLSVLHCKRASKPTPFAVAIVGAFRVLFPGAIKSSVAEGQVWLPIDRDSLLDQTSVRLL